MRKAQLDCDKTPIETTTVVALFILGLTNREEKEKEKEREREKTPSQRLNVT
jgi:hypothetical protein